MTTSTRTDAMPGVAVLEYAPGVEIEAKFEDRGRGSTVTWIGYSGRRGMLDALPTVSPAVLESSRVEGDPAAEPSAEEAAVLAAEARARGEAYSWAWMKVCLDAEGTITGVHAREASSELAIAAFPGRDREMEVQAVLARHRTGAGVLVDAAVTSADE